MAVANEELGESYLESLESALADELSFTFDFEQGPTESRGSFAVANRSDFASSQMIAVLCGSSSTRMTRNKRP